jgi:hypothetical protein
MAPHLWKGLVGWWPLAQRGGGTAFDASGNGHHGTWFGTGPRWAAGKLGQCARWEDAGDVISIPDDPALDLIGPYTASIWVRPAASFPGVWGCLFCKNDYNDTYSWMLNQLTYSKTWHTGMTGGSQTFNHADMVLSEWYHMVLTIKSGEQNAYVDGQELAGQAYTGSIATNADDLYLGYSAVGDFNYAFKGDMSNFALWDRILSRDEIKGLRDNPWAMGRRRPLLVRAPDIAPPVSPPDNSLMLMGLGI